MIMKKNLAMLAVMLAVVVLSSCNSMERKANRQLHDTMKELAKNPDTFKISNEKVVFSNDSMCTISFIGRGQNGFGGYNSSKMEYTLIKVKGEGGIHYNESLLDMEDKKDRRSSIKETIENIDGGYLYGTEKKAYDEFIKKGRTKEEAKSDYLYFQALCNSFCNGRRLDNDD